MTGEVVGYLDESYIFITAASCSSYIFTTTKPRNRVSVHPPVKMYVTAHQLLWAQKGFDWKPNRMKFTNEFLAYFSFSLINWTIIIEDICLLEYQCTNLSGFNFHLVMKVVEYRGKNEVQ